MLFFRKNKNQFHARRFVMGFTPLGKIESSYVLRLPAVFGLLYEGIIFLINGVLFSVRRRRSFRFSQTGFTILELLVVIAIIGMLASFLFVQMTGFRANSRDATREENIRQIKNGLDLYHVTHFRYPAICSESAIDGTADCLSVELINDGVFSKTPVDPFGSSGTCGDPDDYLFCYESVDGSTYTLRYNLETGSIPGKNQGWQTTAP
ncbi:MAG: prepilin-type N-terminal cleavage/methylation domain-containing protein [bacterium]|nr:prepilin-type N-terminal cleavage/methylation domain-containing protein [bacterium]